MEQRHPDVSTHTARLMLEDDADQAIMAEFSSLSRAHAAFQFFLLDALDKDDVSSKRTT